MSRDAITYYNLTVKTFSELNKLEIIFLKSLCGILGPLIYNRRLEHGSKDPEETPQSSRESYSTSGRETTRDLSRCLLFLKFKKPLKQPPPAFMTNESSTAQTSDSFHLTLRYKGKMRGSSRSLKT